MNNEMPIRTVTVELLRAGPPHNQLLSPFIQYLGICGDNGAGVVTQPYEHATFLRRVKAMRYEREGGDKQDRLGMLRDIGVDMAKMLGAIPGLPGALTAPSADAETLVHLRLRLTASELALLPFELSKMPVGPNSADASWLALQTHRPVCITRRSRNASSENTQWPVKPRILFIAADTSNIPFAEHREELLRAVKPFLLPGQDQPVVSQEGQREQFGDLLTILKDASFAAILAECDANAYTYIHILAHGGEDPNAEDTAYGLVLSSTGGTPDVLSGERLACAFARIAADRMQRATVVTLATCDGGNVGSVLVPVASLAHTLHLANIPLVVASQFPLSKAGSVAFVRLFYQDLLWGENPWILLHRIRNDLFARLTVKSHDWASLVFYEALPDNLEVQFEAVRYHQSKRAINAADKHLDRAVDKAIKEGTVPDNASVFGQHTEAARRACAKLPLEGAFSAECLGLSASCNKRLAHAEFRKAVAVGPAAAEYQPYLSQSYRYLEQALIDYQQAAKAFLINDEDKPLQRIATLHWVLVQTLSLSAVLGKPTDDGAWAAAKLSAEAYRDHPSADQRAWAHGSLAELWLLRLVGGTSASHAGAAQAAKGHVQELSELFPIGDPFPIESTRDQFKRYVDWWGQPAFAEGLVKWGGVERPAWEGDGGLVETAKDIIDKQLARHKPGSCPTPLTEELTAIEPGEQEAETGKLTAAAKPAAMQRQATAPALLGAVDTSPSEAFLDIEMLPAGHGDSLWLQYGKGESVSRVLIDCGTESTCQSLQQKVSQLPEKERAFELFILSHIDDDHIGGAIPFFKDRSLGVRFDDIWFNGYRHLPSQPGAMDDKLSAKQGETFSLELDKFELPWNQWRNHGPIVIDGDELPVCTLPGGMRLTLLSPTQGNLATLAKKWSDDIEKIHLTPGKAADFEQFLRATTSTDVDALADAKFNPDDAPHNGSSIAVLAEYQGKSILLGADAYAPVLVASIRKLLKQRSVERLKIDAFKIPHHASQNNLNIELMNLLDCRRYLISTNGDRFKHPDREAVARIIKYGNFGGKHPKLYFNFLTEWNNVWAQAPLQEKYGYEAHYPETGQNGLLVRL